MVKLSEKNNTKDMLYEPLAIIGMSCQFPGMDEDIEDVDAFHRMLVNGQTPIKMVPKNRWDIEKYYDANRKKADKIISRKGGFLNNTDLFDAAFFKISSTEAKQIDPQHRLFLEVSIRALNHANLTLGSLKGSNTGVYCGISTHEYSQLNYKDNIKFNAFTPFGVANSAAVGRLCHFLNLQGPSMAVDTACSSSMSALYLAATALRAGQCNMVIVGGVHLSLCPESFIGLTKANMLSAAGQCSSFDMKADGFVRSEGCGVVIVKRLSDAIKDNNLIHAVIKSIVMNHDGDGASLAAPNVKAQIAMHQAALEQAKIMPSDIDYIEAHGTGTPMGDSVEFDAIQYLHQGHHSKDKPLVIGALKSNLGHTMSSSGIASLIKAIGALRHETIPPNLHYSTPNHSITPEKIPAALPIKAIPFIPCKNKKRCVQVSNFSFSGTNVTAIIEEPPKRTLILSNVNADKPLCFVMSANSEYSLKQMLANIVQYMQVSPARLSDICSTLINCRDHYKFRCAIIINDKEALIKRIESGDYELKKVDVQRETTSIKDDANQIFEFYLAGMNTRLVNDTQYNKVDLPQYCFDRKSYWHEPRKKNHFFNEFGSFLQQSKEQQVETIKTIVVTQILEILKKESIDEYQDFESLGLTKPSLEILEHRFLELFSLRLNIQSLSHLTLDKLARHLQQLIVPAMVHRQPSINVLDVEPIAIVGMSCRFPKAANIDAFLSLLENGESGMVDIPIERWDNEKYYDANVDTPGRLYIKQLGLIDNVKSFDAEFFNISPREAKLMSPQLRIFMEASYHALEDANLSLDSIKDSNTGVFVGCGTNEYPRVLDAQGVNLDELNIYFATGNVLNALPGRVAYAFDFHGPTQAIDTACSSSMTAIHNACLSLQSGDCDMAIAGGINILLNPDSNVTLSKAKMLSPDSRCKTFSEDADGYARSEGCGVVVLKRLSSAIQDNDNILAVIKGSSVNSDGKSGGFTVPNGTAQEEVIRSALAKSKLSPEDIDVIEAHGTGTPVADPIEVNTLTRIFSKYHSQDKPLYISSVKTNIGHSESASGVAGIIKAVLGLQNQMIFKHLNFKKLNPEIVLENTVIPLRNMVWHKEQGLRATGVSSFGFSGANAHMILQQAPCRNNEERILPQQSLLVLSAKSKTSLELLLSSYQKYLSHTKYKFADICYTAAMCRSHFLFRVAIQASTAEEAAAVIERMEYSIYHVKKEQTLLQQSLSMGQLQAAYQDGCLINWFEFYRSLGNNFEKVKLPLYEFAHEEHWFGDKGRLKDALVPKDWCFQLQWKYQPCDKNNFKTQGNNWLLIGGKHLHSWLRAQGLQIVLEDDDYVLEQLDGVIFAEGLAPVLSTGIDANIDFQKQTIKQLLGLVKELNHKAIELRLVVLVTNGIAELAVGKLNISNSSLVGFCKTLTLELPQYHTILIDLDKPRDEDSAAKVMDEITHNHGQCYEHMIAYRDGKRLGMRLKKIALIEKKRSLYGEGRYLITGGCGGLGLITAQALLSAGARELILTSRQIDKPAVKIAINKIQSFYPGRIIRVIRTDVADKDQVRGLLSDINHDGLLKGIVHAAGAVIKAPLIEHRDEDVDYLFSAKVKGGWNLHELSQHLALDFFVVYSSISSVFGSNKESVYTATNSFLDALIAERQRLGLVGTAIQWGPWGEVGMANQRSRDQGLRQALVNNEQGHALIKILINGQLNHAAIISPGFLEFMLDFVPKPLSAFHQCLADDLTNIGDSINKTLSPWLNNYLKVSADKRFTACKDMLTAICKTILDLSEADDLDAQEGFFEIGFDSLMITEMATALKDKLQPSLKVTVNLGFDYPTINKLSKYIEAELDKNLIKKQTPTLITMPTDDSIAIIGMSCSLPNASDLAAFETLLEKGLSGIKDIPIERWDNRAYYDPDMDAPRKSYVNKLGLIENIKYFDPIFFGISPREAKLMEPQQRIFLECCYNVLENANYPPTSLRGSLTGVFVGVGPNEYYAQLEKSGFSNEELSAYSITGNVLNLIPGRVAYTFDFKGPSISIDTACSSSLVAIHYACQGLKNREIDYALAGGVNILLMPESNVTLCKAKALSPDSQCKTFDASADGYARAEGCGVIFLKRTVDAIRDKDNILAIIKASAVNSDGRSAGITVPNGKSQEDVMMRALLQTELSSSDISYVEAHGTGTPLGDPIEAHAINKVYGGQRRLDNPLYLGTVKTNIGHLESAAGVVGIIKTVISLQKGMIYKHLNFNKLNPNIEINDMRIALHNMDWHTDSKFRYAGVNAFGFSGTNAHVILQEFPSKMDHRTSKPVGRHLLVLSAKSKRALDNLAHHYQQYLITTQHDFGDICFTAATCREHYIYRLALTAACAADASRALEMGQFALSHGQHNKLEWQNDVVLQSLFTEYMQGAAIDWSLYYNSRGDDFIKVVLPNYTFDRSEFWPDKKDDTPTIQMNEIHPLLGQMLSMPGNEYLFSHKLDLENLSYIKQQSVFGKMIFPGMAFLECGLAAAKSVFKRNTFCIEKFNIDRPLFPKQGQDIQVQVKPKNDERYKINVFAKQDNNWQLYSEMEIHLPSLSIPESVDIHGLKSSFDDKVDISHIYDDFKEISLLYGNELQVLREGYVKSDSVLSNVSLTKISHGVGYFYHPVVLDGAMQSIFLLSTNHVGNIIYVPYAFTRMAVFQAAPRNIWVHLTKRVTLNKNDLCVDIKLYDNSGLLIGDIEELKLRLVTRNNFASHEPSLQHLYHIRWSALKSNLPMQIELPELWVISKDQVKAKKILGNLRYQLIPDLTKLVNIDNKNIIFLYEQGQFNELFHCCQAMFKLHPNSFILVTENAYTISGDDRVNPYHTMASSFWKSFRNELEFNKIYTIDLGSNGTLITALHYIFNVSDAEDQLAVRDSIYIPRLKKKQLPVHHIEQETFFDSEASYLITGGTGGLAKPLIDYLIQRNVKYIIITSRSECPMDIKALIESAKQKQVCICHYVADASNYQQMESIIESIHRGSKPLKGVFHLAGVVQDSLIVNLSDNDMQRVLSSKVDGALILHQLTKNRPLDMFVLFSSSASLLGARGQSNYVAANGFLDGLAHLRQQQGLPGIAINWGPFHTIGMTTNLAHAMQQYGFVPLTKDCIDILDILLTNQLSQISPCILNWDIYCKHSLKQAWLSDFSQPILPPDQYFFNTLRQLHTKEERVIILSHALCEITANVLALDDIHQLTAKDSLFSMGMDSLMSLEIRNRIYDKLQYKDLHLSIEYFINDPTIDKIARYIADELQIIFDNAANNHLSDNFIVEEIALCDCQYIFWVLNKLNYGFNIGSQIQLHGKLNKDYVFQAFDFVVKQNSVFWTYFSERAPTQTLKKQGQFELVYQDVSLNNNINILNKEFHKNMMRIIPLTKLPLIEVYLYKINNDLHELHIVIPHIIIDGPSYEIVFNQFKENYEALTLGRKLVQCSSTGSYFNYVKQSNYHYEKNIKAKIDFWQDYNRDFKRLNFGYNNHYPDAASNRLKHLFHYTIPSQLIEKFIDWHKEKNRNISTGLIAACQIVFHKISGQKKIPIILLQSGREGSQYKSTVGLFAEYKRINITLNEANGFIDCIKSIEEQLLKTAPYQKCSYVIKDSGLKDSRLSIGQYLTYVFNKLFLTKDYKISKLNSLIIDHYLEYLSQMTTLKKMTSIKYKLNKLFKLKLPLQEPAGLRVLIGITPSFFTKEKQDMSFADLHYTYPSHFGCVDRSTGNRTLWVLFSRNQQGEYQLSINGPLIMACKDQIAVGFNSIISKFVEHDEQHIAELMQEN